MTHAAKGVSRPPRRRLASSRQASATKTVEVAAAYSRSVYASLTDWYKVADNKGQLLLTLNGVFVTVLSGVVLLAPDELLVRKSQLPWYSWALMGAGAVAAACSILCAIMCLRSRLSNAHLDLHRISRGDIPDGVREDGGSPQYSPGATLWFGTLARFEDKRVGSRLLNGATLQFELDALTDQIMQFAPRVLEKHRWVNRGWAAAGAALLFTLAGTVSVVTLTPSG